MLKQKDDGWSWSKMLYYRLYFDSIRSPSALALKALDQRIASAATPPRELGSKAPGHNSPELPSTPLEGSSDSGKVQPERRKSVGEADIGLARSDSKGKGRQKSES